LGGGEGAHQENLFLLDLPDLATLALLAALRVLTLHKSSAAEVRLDDGGCVLWPQWPAAHAPI